MMVIYSGIRWWDCFSRAGWLLLNKLHRTRSMPVLMSSIVSYIDCEVVSYIEYDIVSMLAVKQQINRWWWLDFEAAIKFPCFGDFAAQACCADFPISA